MILSIGQIGAMFTCFAVKVSGTIQTFTKKHYNLGNCLHLFRTFAGNKIKTTTWKNQKSMTVRSVAATLWEFPI
jgi:hypothetical protein